MRFRLYPVLRLSALLGALALWLWAAPLWAMVCPLLDEDRDGLKDAWEIAYFGTIEAACPDADPDGDGLNNRAEQYLGTDPTASDNPARTRPLPQLGATKRHETALVEPRYTFAPPPPFGETGGSFSPPDRHPAAGLDRGDAPTRIGAYSARALWVQWPTDTL